MCFCRYPSNEAVGSEKPAENNAGPGDGRPPKVLWLGPRAVRPNGPQQTELNYEAKREPNEPSARRKSEASKAPARDNRNRSFE